MKTIEFREKTTNISRKRIGYKVGKYLSVVTREPERRNSGWKIFRVDTGVPLLDILFENEDDALEFANWVDKTYGHFMFFWDEYPNANLFSLFKWEQDLDYLIYYELIELMKMKTHISSLDELSDEYQQAKARAKRWLYG